MPFLDNDDEGAASVELLGDGSEARIADGDTAMGAA